MNITDDMIEKIRKCNDCGYCFDSKFICCPQCNSNDVSDEQLTDEEIKEVINRWWED